MCIRSMTSSLKIIIIFNVYRDLRLHVYELCDNRNKKVLICIAIFLSTKEFFFYHLVN